MRYDLVIIMALLILTFIPVIDSVDATTYKPKLIKSHEGITIISSIPTFEPKNMTIEILNVGNGTANFTNYLYTDFLLTDENTFSNLDSYILKSNIENKTAMPRFLDSQESTFFTWIVNSEINDEGTYIGKIFINGSNFEIIPIDVSVTYKVSPWDMLIYSFSGLVVAIAIGSSYEIYERRHKSKNVIDGNYLTVYKTIFEAIKTILVYVDEPKKSIVNDFWMSYHGWLQKSIKEIENEIRQLSLSEKSPGYTSFKNLISLFIENSAKEPRLADREQHEPLLYPMNDLIVEHMAKNNLENIDSINKHVNTFKKQDKIKFIDKLIGANIDPNVSNYDDRLIQGSKSTNPKHRILYFIATSVISSISALLVIDVFTGPYFMNALIAFALGFGIYRSKDFYKLFKNE